jgi:hypothetical protein
MDLSGTGQAFNVAQEGTTSRDQFSLTGGQRHHPITEGPKTKMFSFRNEWYTSLKYDYNGGGL